MHPSLNVTRLLGMAVLAVTCAGAAAVAAAPTTIRLFPAKAPGEMGDIAPEKDNTPPDGKKPGVLMVTNVSEPSLTLFPAASDKGNGAAVIIAPGGGYRFLSWDLEGEEIARDFNAQGVTAFVLKYRVPLRTFDPGAKLPLMDAQRAVSLVRSRAKEWGVNPDKIGLLGFSAGGNLAAKAAAQYEHRAYEAIDAIDQVSCRPDFSVLIYPGGIKDGQDPTRLAPEYAPNAKTPPTFLAVASDDKGCVDDTVLYFMAAKAAGVKSELHVYTQGGHGFGARAPRVGVTASWPTRCAEWMRTVGILPTAAR